MLRSLPRPGRALAVTALAATALVAPAAAAQARPAAVTAAPFTFAVIGDVPYGDTKISQFPSYIDQINADPAVKLVAHLGDIKDGSSMCSDEYFQMIRQDFDRFQDPLVYTVGDNEWTDCHRANNGRYNPLERLAKIRDVFFDQPGHTLGQDSVGVQSQADRGLPEDVSFTRAGVAFAALHVVGSDNGLLPWTEFGDSEPTPEQAAEVQHRTQGVVDLINQTFDRAGRGGNRAVVLMMQADMFDGTPEEPDFGAFRPIVQTIAERASQFAGPVYLLNGDSHKYEVQDPLSADSPWTSFYGVAPVGNLTRITVDGSKNAGDYLRVRVEAQNPAVLSWEQVQYKAAQTAP
jgi:hypothetical protein